MRVRILKKPPSSYGIDGESLIIGRLYNLDASLASALMVDGCAEYFDVLTDEEKRRHLLGDQVWNAADSRGRRRRPTFPLPDTENEKN